MADYDGSLAVPMLSDRRQGRYESNERRESRSIISTEQAHAGTHSLRIIAGGYHDIFYGCDAGNVTVTIWCYPPFVGGCCLQVFDAATLKDEDFNAGVGAFEQLSVTFLAVKKVYTVRLSHFACPDGDSRAYFDDLV